MDVDKQTQGGLGWSLRTTAPEKQGKFAWGLMLSYPVPEAPQSPAVPPPLSSMKAVLAASSRRSILFSQLEWVPAPGNQTNPETLGLS